MKKINVVFSNFGKRFDVQKWKEQLKQLAIHFAILFMLETYQEYLESPSQSHFLQLQQEVIEEDDFDPQGAIVFRLEQLC
ncbi:MAG: hypothetical protein ACKVH8_14950 [Pirellulales bacterium]